MGAYYTSVWFWLIVIGIVLFIIGLVVALYQYYNGSNGQTSTSNISTWVWALLGIGAFLILIGIIFAIVGYDDTPTVVETKTTTTTAAPVAPVAAVPTTTSVVTAPLPQTNTTFVAQQTPPVFSTPVGSPNGSVVYMQQTPPQPVNYVYAQPRPTGVSTTETTVLRPVNGNTVTSAPGLVSYASMPATASTPVVYYSS